MPNSILDYSWKVKAKWDLTTLIRSVRVCFYCPHISSLISTIWDHICGMDGGESLIEAVDVCQVKAIPGSWRKPCWHLTFNNDFTHP